MNRSHLSKQKFQFKDMEKIIKSKQQLADEINKRKMKLINENFLLIAKVKKYLVDECLVNTFINELITFDNKITDIYFYDKGHTLSDSNYDNIKLILGDKFLKFGYENFYTHILIKN